MRLWRVIFSIGVACWPALLFPAPQGTGPSNAPAPVYVLLWFDTEDYIRPEADDAALRVATILTDLGVRGTFKLVGEKARTLERRGRRDVIQALANHDIGYHSNWHSRHPTPAEYLDGLDWDAGVAEFYLRERAGADDVRRIFGVDPSCYGQPGSSWGPQSYPALQRMGIPTYLDEASQVGLDNQPFWYCGMLNVLKLQENVVGMQLGSEAHLERAQQRFRAAYDRLQARGGGMLSIVYHPCEFIHQVFWDAVNFARGRNPLPKDWTPEPIKSPEEIEQAFSTFRRYVEFMQSLPAVRFVTARDLPRLYPDQGRDRVWTPADVAGMGAAFEREISFQRIGDAALSAAEILSLLARTVTSYAGTGTPPLGLHTEPPLGPTTVREAPSATGTVDWESLAGTARDLIVHTRDTGRLPPVVWLNGRLVSLPDFGATLGGVIRTLSQTGVPPADAPLRTGNFAAGQYVAVDDTTLWRWPIFPEGFRPAKVMDLAHLQAWTLKPAILARQEAP